MNGRFEILEKIKSLAGQDRIHYTVHSRLQMTARHMTPERVKEVLISPERLIRVDDTPAGPKYKIQGGRFRRKLAVSIVNEWVVIITVM